MTIEQATEIVSAVALFLFVGLLAASVFRMVQRIILYFRTGRRPSIILRRDIALLGSMLLVFGSLVVVRAFGFNVVLAKGLPRLLFVVGTDIVGIGGLAYWTWVEYKTIGRKGKEDE